MNTRLNTLSLFGVISLLWLVLPMPVKAFSLEQENKSKSIFDHLLRPEALEVTIETDLSAIVTDRRREDPITAVMKYKDLNGREVVRQIDLKQRGKFRRRVCDFPPLKIKFSKKELSAEGLSEHNDLKLVTHCVSDKNVGQDYILREYLIYKLFNELTPESFRVQLARVTYVDTGAGKLGKIKRYAFLMEDEDELAERLGGKECKCLNPTPDSLATHPQQMVAVFQYMVGNEDWDIAMNRNLLMVRPTNNAPVIPVPYDFDFAGLVNASYALPNSNYGLTSIRDRYYLGFPAENQALSLIFGQFISKKEAFFKVVQDFKPLDKSSKEEILAYMETFYDVIDQLEKDPTANWFELLRKPYGGGWINPAGNPQRTVDVKDPSLGKK